jgi:type II secretory pathway pseudopilin PulG
VELLVVISILVILMGVGVRVMQFSVEDRRTREAAREINIYFASARNRAMETGRPCGVMLRRLGNEPPLSLCVVGLDQVEVPPPYAGDTLEAVAQVQMPTLPDGSPDFWPDGLRKAVATCTDFFPGLVRVGDLVQFNYQGPLYEIKGPDLDSDGVIDPGTLQLELGVDLRQGQMVPWPRRTDNPPWSPPVPYQVIRRPTKSAAASLQLPVRAVIDLEFSGTAAHSIGPASDSPVWIMFSPNGSLDRIYHGGEMHLGTEPIYLLVGKQERVPAGSAEDGLANWQDTKNLWVTLSPQTGLVITSEVAAVDPAITDPAVGVRLAREIAREGQSMGGR